jgi:hypothetical protein
VSLIDVLKKNGQDHLIPQIGDMYVKMLDDPAGKHLDRQMDMLYSQHLDLDLGLYGNHVREDERFKELERKYFEGIRKAWADVRDGSDERRRERMLDALQKFEDSAEQGSFYIFLKKSWIRSEYLEGVVV